MYTEREELERKPIQPLSISDPYHCMVCGIDVDPGRIRCEECPPPELPQRYRDARARLVEKIVTPSPDDDRTDQ